MDFDTVKIRLNDVGRGEVHIVRPDGQSIELSASTAIRILAQPHTITQVTIRMIANVEFEGAASINFEEAAERFPNLFKADLEADQ
jgi:hypothetical protein